jgi:hypothetical protein
MNKKYFFLTILCFSCIKIFGQQNFFNVPSSEITEKNKVFFQEQINFYPSNISSNSTFCFGLGNDYEIGVNVLGITYDYNQKGFIANKKYEQPIYPTLGINMQKRIMKINRYSLAIGGQILFPSELSNFEFYTYVNNKLVIKKTTFVAGIYYGNDNYFGKVDRIYNNVLDFGFQFGFEYQIIKDKLFLQADFLTGNSPMSNLIVGGAYKLTKKLIFSSGYQLPNFKKTSSNGVIIELTFIQ